MSRWPERAALSGPVIPQVSPCEWYATLSDGEHTTTGPVWSFTTAPTLGVGALATGLELAPIAPNPAVGHVDIRFTLPSEIEVRIGVFDLQGREIAMLADRVCAAGMHRVAWDGTASGGRIPAGIYLVRM